MRSRLAKWPHEGNETRCILQRYQLNAGTALGGSITRLSASLKSGALVLLPFWGTCALKRGCHGANPDRRPPGGNA
jgi:hypothetical protein